MEFISPLLPNIATGLSIGFSIGSTLGGCFLFYKLYEDYKKKVMYQQFQEKFKKITLSFSLCGIIYLMIRGKISKTIVKTLISQYFSNHENINEINLAIDHLSELFTPQSQNNFGYEHIIYPIVTPGPTSPFYNTDPYFAEPVKVHKTAKPKKATGLNFTSKKTKKETKPPKNCSSKYWKYSSDDNSDISCCTASPDTSDCDTEYGESYSNDIKVNI